MPTVDVSPSNALQQLRTESDLRVLDVRTEPEFDRYHITGADLVPIQVLQSRLAELDPSTSWLVVCEHGVRSEAASQFLVAMGFEDVRNVLGGMARWIGEGLSLERASSPG